MGFFPTVPSFKKKPRQDCFDTLHSFIHNTAKNWKQTKIGLIDRSIGSVNWDIKQLKLAATNKHVHKDTSCFIGSQWLHIISYYKLQEASYNTQQSLILNMTEREKYNSTFSVSLP